MEMPNQTGLRSTIPPAPARTDLARAIAATSLRICRCKVPGLRERRYGTFRLDFGVYVPEMTRSEPTRGDWVNEPVCDLRRTIGQLLGDDDGDWWWPLSETRRRPSRPAGLRQPAGRSKPCRLPGGLPAKRWSR